MVSVFVLLISFSSLFHVTSVMIHFYPMLYSDVTVVCRCCFFVISAVVILVFVWEGNYRCNVSASLHLKKLAEHVMCDLFILSCHQCFVKIVGEIISMISFEIKKVFHGKDGTTQHFEDRGI